MTKKCHWKKKDANPKCRLRRWLQTSGFADLLEWLLIFLSFASLNFKQGQFTEARETPLPEDQVAVLFPRFLKHKNFTDGLRDSLPELKTKQTFHPSTIKRGIKVDFANFSQQTSPYQSPPFQPKKRSGNCPALEKCIKLQQSFPTSPRCPKKNSWLSVDPSQVVAVPFSPRPIPSSSVPTERVNC